MRFSLWPRLFGACTPLFGTRRRYTFSEEGRRKGESGDIATDPESKTLRSTPVALLALATFATFVGFQLLLSVVPLYAGSDGGSSGAGLATAAFMLSTVLTQVRMPRLMVRFGYQTTLMAGMLFLGIPEIGRAHV